MNDDAFKAAEKRGYAKGYQAGRARRKAEQDRERQRRIDQAFLDRAFLAVLPECTSMQNWKRGEKPINSVVDRVWLAWHIAEEALKQRGTFK
jgi:hypothetical protein